MDNVGKIPPKQKAHNEIFQLTSRCFSLMEKDQKNWIMSPLGLHCTVESTLYAAEGCKRKVICTKEETNVVKISNFHFVRTSVPLREEYRQHLSDSDVNIKLVLLDYDSYNHEQIKQIVSNTVRVATNDVFKNYGTIIPLQQMKSIHTNIIVFQNYWAMRGEKRESCFYVTPDQTMRCQSTLHSNMRFVTRDDGKVSVARIPYRKSRKSHIVMYIIVDGDGVRMNDVNFIKEQVFQPFENADHHDKGDLILPNFTIDYNVSIYSSSPQLEKLGLSHLSGKTMAYMTSNSSMQFSGLNQCTRINVDHVGTSMVSVTSSCQTDGSRIIKPVVIDSPFYFLIADGTFIFGIGKVIKPNEKMVAVVK